jgi:hypothetical protein
LARLPARLALPDNSPDRRRDHHADAARAPVTINPVLVIISLVFWYWMWGVPGAILAMPLLAVTKIICDRIQSLAAFGHLIEG